MRAWIETKRDFESMYYKNVALRVRAWIETYICGTNYVKTWCRPPREGVD